MVQRKTVSISQAPKSKRPQRNSDAPAGYIDYKQTEMLRKYLNRFMRIDPARRSGLTGRSQRQLAKAIKRARFLALMPYTLDHSK